MEIPSGLGNDPRIGNPIPPRFDGNRIPEAKGVERSGQRVIVEKSVNKTTRKAESEDGGS